MMEYWNVEKTSESNINWVTLFLPNDVVSGGDQPFAAPICCSGFLDSFGVGIGIGIGIDSFYPVFVRFFLDRAAPLPEPCEHSNDPVE